MRLGRILLVATTVEVAAAGALGALVGLAGAWNEWADAVNAAAPLWMACGLAALVAARWMEGRPRRLALCLSAVAVLGAGWRTVPELISAAAPVRSAPAGAPRLRILTLNAWINNRSPAATLAAVQAAKADLVAIQERRGVRQVREALLSAYPYATGLTPLK